jgi:hypothetical protein
MVKKKMRDFQKNSQSISFLKCSIGVERRRLASMGAEKGALPGSATCGKPVIMIANSACCRLEELKALARIKIEEMNPLYSKNGTSVTGASRDRLHFHLYMGL